MRSALVVVLLLAACGPEEEPPAEPARSWVRPNWAEIGELYYCWARVVCPGGAGDWQSTSGSQCQANLADAMAYEQSQKCEPPTAGCVCEVNCFAPEDTICCARPPPGDGRAGWVGDVCRG